MERVFILTAAAAAMKEFIRDTIANLNGIYYVVSIDPDLLKKKLD